MQHLYSAPKSKDAEALNTNNAKLSPNSAYELAMFSGTTQ